MVALGLIDDPRVATAALDDAEHGHSTAQRLAGLQLLDRIDSSDPATLGRLAYMIATDDDPSIVGKAIFGLGHVSDDVNARHDVLAALATASRHPDPEVRRRAVIALAEWAGDSAQLGRVEEALRDPSPLVRTAAAFAVGRSDHASPALIDHVALMVADPGEDPTVRRIGRNSIASLGVHADVVSAFDEAYPAWR